MHTKTTTTILDAIEKIFTHSQDSHLREPFFNVVKEQIATLCKYLQTTEMESVLFAVAFAGYYDDFDFPAVFKHFGMNEFQMMKYRAEILSLYDKGLLNNKDKRGRKIGRYDVSQQMIESVSESKPIKIHATSQKQEPQNLVDILEQFDQQSDLYDREDIYYHEFTDYIEELVENNLHRPIFQEIERLKLTTFETYFLLDTIWDAIDHNNNDFNTSVLRTVEDYYKTKSRSLSTFNDIIENKTNLTKKNLIELSKTQYVNRTNAKLSKKMLKFLQEQEGLNIENFTVENQKLLYHRTLPKREFVYGENELQKIEELTNLLSVRKFTTVQRQLKSRKMPIGLTVLLHGVPGTGKTESVYQLAKKTGRNIFKVDISETKSMWFGESQKLTKRIFSDYRELCETEKRTPILFFNEADAIIGKRKSAGSTNVADTENAIQNILLEEMENFDGILIATTNLVENMDSAFERRFLFKIKFEKPETKVSSKIWQIKLPFLSDEEALQLASTFDFSGGEMENISRKVLMEEIINATKPSYQTVLKLCSSEKWSENGSKKNGF